MRSLCLMVVLVSCEQAKVMVDASSIDDAYADTGLSGDSGHGGESQDVDGDGFSSSEDCDDTDPNIFPGAEEVCNDLDDDCDGEVDNVSSEGDFGGLWFEDNDGDGFGAGAPAYYPCEPPEKYVTNDGDCADDDPAVHPGVEEICDDGKDNNCDASSDPCVLMGIVPSDQAEQDIVGWNPLERIGTIAQSAGDVNGDGLGDLLVAVPNSSEYLHEAGATYLFTSPLAAIQTIEEADGIFLGSDIEEHAGESIAAVGDINGDGNDDMAFGVPHQSSMGRHSGAVSIVQGPGTGVSNLEDAAYRYVGEGPGCFTGAAIANAGDTDGDGLNEIAIGAPGASVDDVQVGAVYIVQTRGEGTFNLLAEAQSKLVGQHSGNLNQMKIQSAGDFNEDGYGDVIIGAPHMSDSSMPENAGGAYVVFGPIGPSGELSSAATTIRGLTPNGYAGFALAHLSGSASSAGQTLAIGCYNCDGGAPTSGAVFLFNELHSGSYLLGDADATISGEAYQDFAGYAVSNAGDVNGDGVDDLLIGAKGNDFSVATTGAAYLLYGPTDTDLGLHLADLKIHGVRNNDQLGSHVASAGDLDADGLSDFMVSAPLSDTSHDDVGRISIFYGNARL